MDSVIHRIKPGHPEASKTMSLEQAAADADDLIKADHKSLRHLKALIGFCLVVAVLQVVSIFTGYDSLVTYPCLVIMIGCSVSSVHLIRQCKDRIESSRKNKAYFEDRVNYPDLRDGASRAKW